MSSPSGVERARSNRLKQFLIGFAIPLSLSTLWFGVVRALISPDRAHRLYSLSPGKYVAPIVLVGVALGVAAATWRSHRPVAYGSIATLIPALAISVAILGAAAASG